MAEICPDCGRARMNSAGDPDSACLARWYMPADLQQGAAISICKDLIIACLRRELAAANDRAREVAYDAFGIQAPGHSTNELLDAIEERRQREMADGSGAFSTLLSETAELRGLAFPTTHNEEGSEDSDEVCDVCAHSAEHGKHTYKDCVANLEAVGDQVTGYLGDENARLTNELAEARAIGELAWDAGWKECDLYRKVSRQVRGAFVCPPANPYRAATGEPKETT